MGRANVNMIGVFDSGLGGLTIAKSIYNHKLDDILYVGDHAYLPYGSKKKAEIIERADKITQYLLYKNAKLILIACNTATLTSIEYLRNKYPEVKFVGVEPAIKPASGCKGRIVVLATQATLKSNNFRNLINKHLEDAQAEYHAFPEWVEIVESGEIGSTASQQKILGDVNLLNLKEVKCLVMACTHYPYFSEFITSYYPSVDIIEPTLGVIKQLKKLIPSEPKKNVSFKMVTTGSMDSVSKAVKNLLHFPITLTQESI